MLRKLHEKEEGFTLIELLVVILIVGILAAIALPTFLGQQKKGQDASAKSDARNAVSQIEACFTDQQKYSLCDSQAEVPQLPSGGVFTSVTDPSGTGNGGYTITYTSKSGNTFAIKKNDDGSYTRTCTGSSGGCGSGGSW